MKPERGVNPNKTIKKDVVVARKDADIIQRDAGMKAERIIEEAKSQAEQIKENAWNEGKEEALAQYTQEIIKAKHAYDDLIASIEPRYIKLVRTCVEKIVGEELKLNEDLVVGMVRTTLQAAAQQREINIRINPEDQEALKRHRSRLLDVLARAGQIEIRADPSIARGGCIVVTELGTIDATLERQLTAIEEALMEELEAGEGGEEAEASEEEMSSDEAEGY